MPDAHSHPDLPPAACLLRDSLAFPRKTAIVDIGANPVNPAPYTPLLRAGGCTVTGFEPQDDAFAELQRLKGPDETYFPFALGDGGRHNLHIYRNGGFTSIFPPHVATHAAMGRPRWSRVDRVIEMETKALDDIPDLGPCDLLKIDIQGGEKLVLDHGRRSLSEAVAVIVELRYLQLYENEPMMGGVDSALRDQGFMLHKFLFNKALPLPSSQSARLNRRRVNDQLVDGDAVYLRHPGHVADWSDAQLMHCALLAASVFGSHSLVLWALDDLIRRKACADDLPARYVDLLPDSLLSEEEIAGRKAAAAPRKADPKPATSSARSRPAAAGLSRSKGKAAR